MRRHPAWRSRLALLIEARRRAPESDCGLFVADCVAIMTGTDLAASYRGRYATVREGLELLQADGYADLCAFAAANLEEIPPALARTGDVMAIPSEATGWALGIVNGERVTVLRGDGIGTVSRDTAGLASVAGGQRAFRVP